MWGQPPSAVQPGKARQFAEAPADHSSAWNDRADAQQPCHSEGGHIPEEPAFCLHPRRRLPKTYTADPKNTEAAYDDRPAG